LQIQSGDDVTIIKVATKIKNTKLVESADYYNMDCNNSGIGVILITPKFVKNLKIKRVKRLFLLG